MMIITAEQIKTISEGKDRQFIQKLLLYFNANFPDEIQTNELLNDVALEEWIAAGLKKARSYGVIYDTDLTLFLECKLILGTNFDTNVSWAENILNDEYSTGEQKMEAIQEYLIFGWENESK